MTQAKCHTVVALISLAVRGMRPRTTPISDVTRVIKSKISRFSSTKGINKGTRRLVSV
ncbi:MAG TPA: hypothetical protein VFF30_15550 [Nitrososphaerales archaeon]|nr:hypothetical protein [Nitrososphaerales archaeon]